jgi:hypothetical protein
MAMGSTADPMRQQVMETRCCCLQIYTSVDIFIYTFSTMR